MVESQLSMKEVKKVQIGEITEAITQMTGSAIVIRNQFVLGFGTDLASIASNLTKLEQEMQRKKLLN